MTDQDWTCRSFLVERGVGRTIRPLSETWSLTHNSVQLCPPCVCFGEIIEHTPIGRLPERWTPPAGLRKGSPCWHEPFWWYSCLGSFMLLQIVHGPAHLICSGVHQIRLGVEILVCHCHSTWSEQAFILISWGKAKQHSITEMLSFEPYLQTSPTPQPAAILIFLEFNSPTFPDSWERSNSILSYLWLISIIVIHLPRFTPVAKK